MNKSKRIKRDFNIMLLKTTLLVVIGAFLFNTAYALDYIPSLRPLAAGEKKKPYSAVAGREIARRSEQYLRLGPIPEDELARIKALPTTTERLKALLLYRGVTKTISIREFAQRYHSVSRTLVANICKGKIPASSYGYKQQTISKFADILDVEVGLLLPASAAEKKTQEPKSDWVINYEELERLIKEVLDNASSKMTAKDIADALQKRGHYQWLTPDELRNLINSQMKMQHPELSTHKKYRYRAVAKVSEIFRKADEYLERIKTAYAKTTYVKRRFIALNEEACCSPAAMVCVIHYCRLAIAIASTEPDKKMVSDLIKEAGLMLKAAIDRLPIFFKDKGESMQEKEKLALDMLNQEIRLIGEDFEREPARLNNLRKTDYEAIEKGIDDYVDMLICLIDPSWAHVEKEVRRQKLAEIDKSLRVIPSTFLDRLRRIAEANEERIKREAERQMLSSVLRPRAAGERQGLAWARPQGNLRYTKGTTALTHAPVPTAVVTVRGSAQRSFTAVWAVRSLSPSQRATALRPRAARERKAKFPPLTPEQKQQILKHKTIGWRLLETLQIRDITQDELIRISGFNAITVYRIMGDSRSLRRDTLEHLAAVLNVDRDIFILDEPPIAALAAPIPDDALAQILEQPTPTARFKALRISRGFKSYAALARKSGIAPSTIRKIERGIPKYLKRETVLSLARALVVEEELFNRMGFSITGSGDEMAGKVLVPESEASIHARVSEILKAAKQPLTTKDIADALGLPSCVVYEVICSDPDLTCHDNYEPRLGETTVPPDLAKARNDLLLAEWACQDGFYNRAIALCRTIALCHDAIDLSKNMLTSKRPDILALSNKTIKKAKKLLAKIKQAMVFEALKAEFEIIKKRTARKIISPEELGRIQQRLNHCCRAIIMEAVSGEEELDEKTVELLKAVLKEKVEIFLSDLLTKQKRRTPKAVSSPDDKSILTSVLRPRAVGERHEIPAAVASVGKDEFIASVDRWIHENVLDKRFGRLAIIESGAIRFSGALTPDETDVRFSVDIVPAGGRRLLSPEGAFAEGIDCLEGAWQLLQELRAKGYLARLRKGHVGIWGVHRYVEANLQGEWIPISTTPDMPHFDLPIVEVSPLPLNEEAAEATIERFRTRIDISTGELIPMEFFSAAPGKNAVLTGGLTFSFTREGVLRQLCCNMHFSLALLDESGKKIMTMDYPYFAIFIRDIPHLKSTDANIRDTFEMCIPDSADPALQEAKRHVVNTAYTILMRMDDASAMELHRLYEKLDQKRVRSLARAAEQSILRPRAAGERQDLAWGQAKGAAALTAVWAARPLSPSQKAVSSSWFLVPSKSKKCVFNNRQPKTSN